MKAWLWIGVTEFVTVFPIRMHRNRTAFDDFVGPTPAGCATKCERFSSAARGAAAR